VWGATLALLALLAGLLATPGARAAMAEFLQIGVVRIFQRPPEDMLPPPTAQPVFNPSTSASPSAEQTPRMAPSPTAVTPRPTPVDLAGLSSVFGELPLAEARRRVDFPVRLPSYPPDLGEPDQVFLQKMNGNLLILAWADPQQPQRARLSLHIITPGSFTLSKIAPKVLQETQVNGLPAIWAEGPYLLLLDNGDTDIRRLIDGHVLIWEQDGMTYRLETDLPMDEAVRIAESLQ
jgi:hypothetical protein